MQHFLLTATIAISEKLLFSYFHGNQEIGKIGKQGASSKSCSLSIKTIPGKMETNR